jgi:hypothetical protein
MSKALKPAEVVVYLIVAVGVIAYFATRTPAAPTSKAPVKSAESAPIEEKALSAAITFNGAFDTFHIENQDSFPWSNCEFDLNPHGLSSGFSIDVAKITPGAEHAVAIEVTEFADGEGKRFDPVTHKVVAIVAQCDTPEGRRYFSGSFGQSAG